MRNLILLWGWLLLASQAVSSQVIIHVLNPWRDDTCAGRRDNLRQWGREGSCDYPGCRMTPEGGSWFYYTHRDISQPLGLSAECGPQAQDGRDTSKTRWSVSALLATVPAGTTEIWIVPELGSTKMPLVYDHPPKAKVLYLFNPWPDNSPLVIVRDRTPTRMYVMPNLCGWYRTYFVSPVDSLYNIKFTDYYRSKKYTASGMVATGAGIDLREFYSSKDTVYILPAPFPDGPPSLTPTFPGRTGDCGVRKISGMFRDWVLDTFLPQNDRSFWNQPIGAASGHKGMIQDTLTGPDFKPKKTTDPAVSVAGLGQVERWYKTDTFPDGRDNDTCIELTIKKGDDGRWQYTSNAYGGFFPLDSFNDRNNVKYSSSVNPNDTLAKRHNYHFTMEMHFQFVYHKGANQEFDFTGDDDMWVFINKKLAIDLGGLNNSISDTIYLDRPKVNLGLEDGKMYAMDIFFAERNPVGSNFTIKTSLDLQNTNMLYYKQLLLGVGRTQYDIWQRVSAPGLGCGQNLLDNPEELASVNFFIEGPQFNARKSLGAGVHYGGVVIDPGNSRVTIDSAAIQGLMPGEYRVTFVSTVDSTRSGYLVFYVPPKPPHHLDILDDKTALDLKKDAQIDSILIGLNDATTQVYAVIRDTNGLYLNLASKPTWTSRNVKSATVEQSPDDPSRCIITKTGTGVAWVVVSDPAGKLKPDSVKVVTFARPPYPQIRSAVMLDGNADLIPDTLRIALTDTFKTGQSIDSVVLAYRSQQLSFSGTAVRGHDTVVLVATSITQTDGRPSGQVTLFMATVDGEKSDTKPFTDGVCPALIKADVLENDGTQPDVLFLKFSEPVSAQTVAGRQLQLIRAASGDTSNLMILQAITKIDDSTFAVQIAAGDPKAYPGDKLRLVPGNAGGQISDLSKNRPHDLNRAVVIGFRPGAALISSAWYLDVNADGRVDWVVVRFKRKVLLSEIDSVVIQWKLKYYSARPASVLDDSTISFALPQIPVVSTGGSMDVVVAYTTLPKFVRSTRVADSAAPVIAEAELFPGEIGSGDSRLHDSLRIRFSEAVVDPGARPFLLSSRDGGVKYRFNLLLLSAQNDECRFVIQSIEPAGAVLFARDGDTIWIDPAALVKDNSGNVQLNPLNRRALLKVTWPKPEWKRSISSNPFTPFQTPIPAEYARGGTTTGTVVVLWPTTPVDAEHLRGEITIFDALGNTVASSPMKWTGGKFYFVWNGQNLKTRITGSGTYLGVAKIYNNNTLTYNKDILIGVKR